MNVERFVANTIMMITMYGSTDRLAMARTDASGGLPDRLYRPSDLGEGYLPLESSVLTLQNGEAAAAASRQASW